MLAVTAWVRVLVAVSGLGVVWALPEGGAFNRPLFVGLVAFVYLPYSLIARRLVRPPFSAAEPVALASGDLLILFAFQVLVPATGAVAVLGYFILVAFYASAGGMRIGAAVGALSVVLAWVGRELAPSASLSTFTLSMFPAAVVALCVVLEAARRSQRHARFFALSSDLLSVASRDGYLKDANASWEMVLGYTREELFAQPFAEFIHPDDRDRTAAVIAAAAPEHVSVLHFENRYRTKDGSYRWLSWRAVASPREAVYYCVARDVTAEKEAEDLLAHRAHHDALTELPNRVLLLDRLCVALARGARRPDSVAVLFLDLDDFKIVNDGLGHAAGDRILAAMAERLSNVLRPADTVARFGGDEFVVLCEDLTGREHGRSIADRLMTAIAPPFSLQQTSIHVTASIGIAFAGADGHTPEELLRDADAAMYRAKERGPGEIVVFDAALRGRAMARLETETALRVALERDELRLFYQPGVELRTGRTAAVEALLRWEHPTRGLLPPSEFLSVAERTGLIVPIGAWVLNEACRQLAAWREEMPDVVPLGVAVNVSSRQLMSSAFTGAVKSALAASGLDPWNLYLEVTEGTLMDDGVALAVLEEVANLGVLVGLDDFGTGYSSLDRLRQMPIRFLKLDRSFVSGPSEHAGDPELLSAVSELAYALRMPAVAEGPETAEQVELLKQAGFAFAQGNWFGEAAPADVVAHRLRATRLPLPANG
jgi:diguanylate cyclase (GGDEF)-like protein/PAS domain S-box-containing protein